MLILGEHPRPRDQDTQSVPGVSGNSKEEEEDRGVGAGVDEPGKGKCQSMSDLADLGRDVGFHSVLQGQRILGLTLYDKSGLSGLQSSESQVQAKRQLIGPWDWEFWGVVLVSGTTGWMFSHCIVVALSPLHICTPVYWLHSFCLLPEMTIVSSRTKKAVVSGARLSHFCSVSISILPAKTAKILISPWLDDIHAHGLIKSRRAVWAALVGQSGSHAPYRQGKLGLFIAQWFSSSVTLSSSLRGR